MYILCSDRIPKESSAPVHALALVPWRAVIDFDPDSDDTGLLSVLAGPLQTHRVVHRAVKGDYRVQPDPGTHWFFARGLSGRHETLSTSDHRTWLKLYKSELGKQLERLVAAVSPSPVTVVVLWNDAKLRPHLRTLLEELQGGFGDLASIVVVSGDESTFGGVCDEAEVSHVTMSLRGLCSGIADHFADQEVSDERMTLPTPSGAFVEVESRDRLWLSEDLDVAYRGVGTSGEDSSEQYRRGGTISWRNLHLRHDCERDVTPALRTAVENDLKRRKTVRLNLYHSPGAGVPRQVGVCFGTCIRSTRLRYSNGATLARLPKGWRRWCR